MDGQQNVVEYSEDYSKYHVRYYVSQDSLSYKAIVTSSTGANKDEILNWNFLTFPNVIIDEEDVGKQHFLAHIIYALDTAYTWVEENIGTAFGDHPQFGWIFKLLEEAGRVIHATADALPVANDANEVAKIVFVRLAQDVTYQALDEAEKKLKEDLSNLPLEARDIVFKKIEDAVNENKQIVTDLAVTIYNSLASSETLEDAWLEFQNIHSENLIDEYKEIPGFDNPYEEWDDPDMVIPPKSPPIFILPTLDQPISVDQGDDNPNIILGTSLSDRFYPKEGDDISFGLGGDDTFIAGTGQGNDHYDGGEGQDTIVYPSSSLGVSVDLESGKSSGNEIDEDTITNIENIIGGSGDDDLVGDIKNNLFEGGAGNDRLNGREGIDTAQYQGKSADFSIMPNQDNSFTIQDNNNNDGLDEGNDHLQNIEFIKFIHDNITIELSNNNTPATIAGNLNGHIKEDKTISVSGLLTIFDPDVGEGAFLAGLYSGLYGNIELTEMGRWIYSVNNATDSVQNLSNGESLQDSVDIISVDGTVQSITITISGMNESKGHSKNQIVDGSYESDFVKTKFGHDVINTFAGDDHIITSGGRDLIYAGSGNDFVNSGYGKDLVFGGDGNDELNGKHGKDELRGGIGHDKIIGGPGSDLLLGEEGDDFIIGGRGNDKIEGGIGADVLIGSHGNDKIQGNEGNDELEGGHGNDYLDGGDNNDLIIGGKGRDQLFGGNGIDTFGFDLDRKRDIVQDFEDGIDKIGLEGLAFEDLTVREKFGSALLSYHGSQLLLTGVMVDQIEANDFIIL